MKLLILLMLLQAINSYGGSDFSIYEAQINDDKLKFGEILSINQLRRGKLLINSTDVNEFDIKNYSIKLTKDAARIMTSIKVPSYFLVCIGEKNLFYGAFYSNIFSASMNCIIIMVPFKDEKIVFRKGYPRKEFFVGLDKRLDESIIRSLNSKIVR
jgi:hypothetical protein